MARVLHGRTDGKKRGTMLDCCTREHRSPSVAIEKPKHHCLIRDSHLSPANMNVFLVLRDPPC